MRTDGLEQGCAADTFSVQKILSGLKTQTIARNIKVFDILGSTNAYCMQHGDELENGTLVVADMQETGKGSRGRNWCSPAGVSVYMSVVLKPDIVPYHAPRLTPVMALSIVRAMRKMGIEAQIKWPNDVVVNGKKLVGILTEMSCDVAKIRHVVIGVGINVLTRHFPEDIAHRATSLFLETGKEYSRTELVCAVMNCFEEDYQAFLATGDLSLLLRQYIQFSATVGKEVRILAPGNEYGARALDVDEEGRLLVEREDGERLKVFADEVSVRGIYGYV